MKRRQSSAVLVALLFTLFASSASIEAQRSRPVNSPEPTASWLDSWNLSSAVSWIRAIFDADKGQIVP